MLCPESYLTMLADHSDLRTRSLSDTLARSDYWKTYDTIDIIKKIPLMEKWNSLTSGETLQKYEE